MFRVLTVCALLPALTSMLPAQEKKEKKEVVKRITIYPAAEPKPALKYQLLPELSEMNPGNPIMGYMKCFAEQNNFFHSKGAIEQREKWLDMPLNKLPVAQLRGYSGSIGTLADDAARMTNPDWQTLIPLRKHGIVLLLPEVQQMRELANVLKIRFRGEIADRRFDDALVTAKTMFALARHFGEHPTLVGDLVGFAIAVIAIEPLEEMIQQPGCPNLFWALTNLPKPLIEIRQGVQGERFMWRKEFEVVKEDRPMTKQEIDKAIAKGQELVAMITFKKDIKGVVKAWLDKEIKDPAKVKAVRGRLVELGIDNKLVQKLPPEQVILVDAKKAHEIAYDDTLKLATLPYWQAEEIYTKMKKQKKHAAPLLEIANPFGGFRVLQAQTRPQQRLAYLIHIEALRAYAAEHGGKLPQKLSEIPLPLPVDPVSGNAFQYTLEGKTATLRGAVPKGREHESAWNRKYVITVG